MTFLFVLLSRAIDNNRLSLYRQFPVLIFTLIFHSLKTLPKQIDVLTSSTPSHVLAGLPTHTRRGGSLWKRGCVFQPCSSRDQSVDRAFAEATERKVARPRF